MNETRDAMHLMACCKWVESASNAIAINTSPDANFVAKGPWLFPTLVADVDCYTLVHS